MILSLLLIVCALVAPDRGDAQATPYVPNRDGLYGDVDALLAVGMVKTIIAGQRPYSRLTFARLAVEARASLDGDAGTTISPRFLEALTRLEEAFSPEIEALCVRDPEACVALVPGVTSRTVFTEVTWANSPGRAMRTSYDGGDFIDAEVNPLLQRNQGREWVDGGTFAVEGQLDLSLGPHLAGQLSPRAWVGHDGDVGVGPEATLYEGYLRGLLGNFAVEAGRNHVTSGHGQEGGAILSNNARGLDMVRLSLDRPARLPGFLAKLGPLGASALVADMGGNSDTPHSKLVIFEVGLRPHANLEVGATLLNHQGGEGAPTGTFLERLEDLFLIRPQGEPLSDKVLGADLRWTLPSLRSQLSVEVLTTDEHEWLSSPDQALAPEAVWVVGAKRFGVGPEGRVDVWVEGRKAGVRPHTHHQFTSGLTLDGRVIGDPLGPLATGLSVGLDWRGRSGQMSVSGAWERYSGDVYGHVPGGAFAWVRFEDNPDEVRTRLEGSWTSDPGRGRLTTSVRVGVEAVDGFAFTTENRTNFMTQFVLGYRW